MLQAGNDSVSICIVPVRAGNLMIQIGNTAVRAYRTAVQADNITMQTGFEPR